MWDALGMIMIAEVETRDPPVFRYRLHGSIVARNFDQDMTGKTIQGYRSRFLADVVQRDYAETLHEGIALAYRVRIASGERTAEYERCVFPLAEDGRSIDALLIVARAKGI
jgi:hypothetical protein